MSALRPLVVLVAALLAVTAVEAGHENPFYPSFYPQEIKVEALSGEAAAARLRKPSLHAYAGTDPFRTGTPPPHVVHAESLDGYVALTFARSATTAEASTRCGVAARVQRALQLAAPDYVFHPYPVTPYSPDYLAHVDLAEAARKRALAHDGVAGTRIRAKGRWGEALRAAGWRVTDTEADATVEEIPLVRLLAASGTSTGWSGPPWIKDGWFHAYLLQAGVPGADAALRGVEKAFERRVRGDYASLAERLNLERRLVSEVGRGCERVTIGYTLKREALSQEYSEGVENVAWDSQLGLASAIFVRTVKLKDFPWNGWLQLGTDGAPAAAWNPVAGFGDAAGRLVWAALGDPAFLPAPRGDGWVANRVRPTGITTGPVPVPGDAVVPERGTGALRAIGAGTMAGTRVSYRVLASKFHDGTKMTPADLAYALAFPFRWSARGGAGYDPEVDRATALLRTSLIGFKVLRVDTDIKEMGELQLVYEVPHVDVYLRHGGDPREAPALAAPWSAVPWQLLALMEEAVARGLGAFSETEARRRGVPWLDLVRDRKVKDGLAALAEGLERRAYVPPALRGFVTVEQARQRWAALRRFHRTHGHFLVTNGPYQLGAPAADAIVLGVFRDLTYPLGVGAWDRHALPLRAFVTRAERRGDRVHLQADVETVVKFERSYRIAREPYRPQPAGELLRTATPVAHYAVLDAHDEVVLAGTSDRIDGGQVALDFTGALARPGAYRVVVALALDGNLVTPEVKVIPYRVGD